MRQLPTTLKGRGLPEFRSDDWLVDGSLSKECLTARIGVLSCVIEIRSGGSKLIE